MECPNCNNILESKDEIVLLFPFPYTPCPYCGFMIPQF